MSYKGDKPRGSHKDYVAGAERINWHREALHIIKDNSTVLTLTLKKEWFDMIASGIKTEEYREIKQYWTTRFRKDFTHILFRNGYSKDCPEMLVECKGIMQDIGLPEWGAVENKKYWVLSLGEIVWIKR